MESTHNFRTAIHGFNREDVVQYISYLTTKHANTVNQLQSELQALQDAAPAEDPQTLQELDALREENAALKAECDRLTAQNAALADAAQEAEALKQQLAAVPQATAPSVTEEELAAYRRAEQAERAANARAQQICTQATGALADATAQVDSTAMQFKAASADLSAQIALVQAVLDSGRNALLDAAAAMYAIHPQQPEA